MKRFLVTVLSILYLASATGATIHVHYCMGKLIGASLVHKEDHKCGRCGMERSAKGNGCCKDEYKVLKANDQHLFAKIILNCSAKQSTAATLPIQFQTAIPFATQCTNSSSLINAPPPDWRRCPIYIQVRNLRI